MRPLPRKEGARKRRLNLDGSETYYLTRIDPPLRRGFRSMQEVSLAITEI